MIKPATIDKAADTGSGVFVVLTCVLAFISGSIIIAPDTVYAITSPKSVPSVMVAPFGDDGDLPPITEKEFIEGFAQ